MQAIAHARAANAKLVISRLDRLARNASVVTALMQAGVSFVVADAPWASEFTLILLSAIAHEEALLISSRMKEVRAAAKAAGRVWRHVCNLRPEEHAEAVRLSAEIRKRRTRERYAYVEPTVAQLRREGLSYARIASDLNAKALRTQRGTPWSDVSVQNLLRRLGLAPPHRRLRPPTS